MDFEDEEILAINPDDEILAVLLEEESAEVVEDEEHMEILAWLAQLYLQMAKPKHGGSAPGRRKCKARQRIEGYYLLYRRLLRRRATPWRGRVSAPFQDESKALPEDGAVSSLTLNYICTTVYQPQLQSPDSWFTLSKVLFGSWKLHKSFFREKEPEIYRVVKNNKISSCSEFLAPGVPSSPAEIVSCIVFTLSDLVSNRCSGGA